MHTRLKLASYVSAMTLSCFCVAVRSDIAFAQTGNSAFELNNAELNAPASDVEEVNNTKANNPSTNTQMPQARNQVTNVVPELPATPQPIENIPVLQEDAATATAVEIAEPQPSAPQPSFPPMDKAPLAPDLPAPNEFAGAPYVPGSLKDLAYGEAPEEYVVETGDTLYDICDQLIDEPDYWPKLWALNPEIRNPHFIYPNMRLRFFAGDATNPPFLNVVEEDDVVPIDKGGLVEAQMMPQRKDLSHLLLDAMKPVDVPILASEELAVASEIAGDFEVWGETYKNTQISLVVPAFVLAEEPEELGVVVAGIEGQTLSGYNTHVIVDGSGFQTGSTYTVLRASGSVRRPDTSEFVGYRYEFVGNVVAKAAIDADHTEVAPSYVRLGIKTGDILVRYLSTQRSIPTGAGDSVGSASSPEGVILGFDQPGRVLGGVGDLVLLSAKASPGAYVKVYRDLRKNAVFARSAMPEAERVAGYVRVVDTIGEASLGYIVRNDYDLRVGDTTSKANM